MKNTIGERLGLRCNNYYITCRTVDEFDTVITDLTRANALDIRDFYVRTGTDGILVISRDRVPSFRGTAYKEWKKITSKIYTGRK